MNIAKFFIPLAAAIPALAIAMPATAQPGYGQQGSDRRGNDDRRSDVDMNMSARVNQLQMRFDAGLRSGSITRREAPALRQQLRQLTQLERRYSANGISGQERGELQRRMRDVRTAIRRADGNDQARWDGYDREDGCGRDGLWVAVRSDVSGGPRSPHSGMIDDVLGNVGFRVGQQASGLRALSRSQRGQFRDGNGAIYRTDGRNIYQVDARTQMVIRVHPMNR